QWIKKQEAHMSFIVTKRSHQRSRKQLKERKTMVKKIRGVKRNKAGDAAKMKNVIGVTMDGDDPLNPQAILTWMDRLKIEGSFLMFIMPT
nr:hypothetical protein [Tanacetum cinerariifolium]